MRRYIAIVVVGAISVAGLIGAAPGGAAEHFHVEPFSETQRPGGSVAVAGHGCPPTGEFATESPLVLTLVPPGGAYSLAPVIRDGSIEFVSTTVYVAGESTTVVTPGADGSFSAVLPVPADAPGGVYTVRGWCTGLLQSGDAPLEFSEASLAAAQTEQGSITIEVATPTPAPTPSPAAGPAEAAVTEPAFTG